MPAEALHFRRRFLIPDAILLSAELLLIGGPLLGLFEVEAPGRRALPAAVAVSAAVLGAAWAIGRHALALPLNRAVQRRLGGQVLDAQTQRDAYRALLALPRRATLLRIALWLAGGLAVGVVLVARDALPARSLITVAVVTGTHACAVGMFRALYYQRLLEQVRDALLPDLDPVRRFAEVYRARLVLAALATGALGILGLSAFTYFFIPINLEQYLRLQTYFPLTVGALLVGWYAYFRRLLRPIDAYLAAALSAVAAEQPTRQDPRALAAYRAAQTIPYRLAIAKVISWVVAQALLVLEGVLFFSLDFENAALIGGQAMVVTVGAALYEALWHRATLRPLLSHVAARHQPPPEAVRTPLSLRSKMLLGFGALTYFACGLSLFWSFMQYKTMATAFIQRESELRLDAALSDLREAGSRAPLTQRVIRAHLQALSEERSARGRKLERAVYYYLPPGPYDHSANVIGFGGGPEGPPPLPWTGEALMRRLERGQMELSAQRLTGAYARLYVDREDLGAVAVLLPGYRGRGPSTAPQIRVLLFFFIVLLVASMGIVVLIAADLTQPIRELERRADAMAKGDLVRPVLSAAAEADEVGRLTFAIEDLRRALNDKLRSSTEINLSLEQEVTRRTAELERRNRELNDALEQLERAQGELVRSEKMASMGRLVAGIAHEINNPVNAVVNTVGPLESTLRTLDGKSLPAGAAEDLEEMIRVIQRGAARTKEIVQALHNYSRGDDDRLGDVDLQRGIDDSLDLLRHHLRAGITVERAYGDVGRVRGQAGQLHQVFMNLITNSAQALEGRGGRIRIATKKAQDKVIISVSDDGPGIPPDVLPRIFDPFFTTKDVGQGSGLGLSIVHGIVERHGGTIAVESHVGKGTTFTVTLPSV
jgi:signal transduction histidine kinase